MKRKYLTAILVIVLLFSACGGQNEAAFAQDTPQGPQKAHPAANLAGAGIFSEGYQWAYKRLLIMTPEEKAGQVLLSRCPAYNGVEEAQNYHLGGYVLFRRDFQNRTKDQVTVVSQSYRKAGKIPLVLAVDEEGGTVVRISSNPNLSAAPFPSPGQLYRQGGLEAVVADSQNKAALLTELGIDVLLAPVADISTSPADYMYPRTLGAGTSETEAYAAAAVQAVQEGQVSATLKHFPGYGANLDTHGQLAVDHRPWEAFQADDLKPFQAGIEAGAHCVLVSHNIIEALDPEIPASLSPEITRVLRVDLGFTGIIMTDDLVMEGARSLYAGEEPVVQALRSGKDMLIVSDYQSAHEEILRALQEGTLDEEILDQAVFRILAWKYTKGLL